MIENFIKANSIEYYKNAKLKKYNTYKINASCDYLLFPNNKEDIIKIIKYLKENNYKFMVLGNGSNVIFKNVHYDGVIIKLDKLNNLIRDNNFLIVEAGYSLIKLSAETAIMGLSGLEFASGIPGSVGASIAMNAGAYNNSISEIIEYVEIIDEKYEIKKMYPEELKFGYRDSIFKNNKDYIVISCKLKMQTKDKKEIIDTINKRRKRRQETQPLNYPSAGSVFRNPEGQHAGALIEQCNLKGYKIGGAMISEKHANFIINYKDATGEDIINLINYTKEKVKEKYNIELVLEQIIID